MKRKTLNKILILALTLSLTFCAVASAKTVKTQSRFVTSCSDYIDPFPEGGGRPK